MNLRLDFGLTAGYSSNSQRARVLTESWVGANLYCPVCGNAVGSLNNERPSTPKKEIQNQEEGLSTWVKIALGVAGLLAFIGICGGFADGMWIVVILSLCAMGAICAVFMGIIEKKYAWTTAIVSYIILSCAIGASAPNEKEGKQGEQTQEASNEKQSGGAKESKRDFFEKGYKYSTSYRVRRNKGNGISCDYKYIIKIFNDGTREISVSNQTDDGSPATYGTHSCEIEKQSGSYRDVKATWYEIKFESGYSWGGKYHISKDIIYVDLDGNVIMLGENGNNKNIYEAVSTKDCIYGKFKKEKLGNEVHICKTCGKEYDPGKEALYSEEYCYNDYPQTCKYCGKTYTINTDGHNACLGTCSRCYEENRNARIFREVTGRDY